MILVDQNAFVAAGDSIDGLRYRVGKSALLTRAAARKTIL